MLPDQFHNGRSDDNAVSDAANDSGLFWCSYAKADCDGEIGIGFQASDGFFNAVQRSLLFACYTRDGNVIEEATRAIENGGKTVGIGRRRCEADEVNSLLPQCWTEFAIFLG